MSQPEPFETQNVHDDDAQVLDALFIETDAPPNLDQAVAPILVKALQDPPVFTRIMSKEQIVDPTWPIPMVQLLPSDARRKFVFFRVESPTAVATDGIRISDDPGMVGTAGMVLHGKDGRMDYHTGPIYIYSCNSVNGGVSSAKVSVSVWTVTE